MTVQFRTAGAPAAFAVFAASTPAVVNQTRVELKHCVPEDVADSVLRTAGMFLEPERGMRIGEAQEIRSLYLDSSTLTFFRWHVAQATDRFKLRIRAYGPAQPEYVYAEIKRKVNSISRKRRARIPFSMLRAALEGADVSALALADRSERANLEQFLSYRLAYGGKPQLLTRSIRQSLRGADGDVTAVTVDRQVSYRRTQGFELEFDRYGWRTIDLPQPAMSRATAIVEVKHGSPPPAWIVPLLQRLSPWRTSFSKYISAMRDMEPWQQ